MKARCSCADPSCRQYGAQVVTFRHRTDPTLRATWRLCSAHAVRELLRHAGGDWACSSVTILAG